MHEEVISPPVDIKAGGIVGGAVDEAIRIRFVCVDKGGAQSFGGVTEELWFNAVSDVVCCAWMSKANFFGVQAEARKIRAGIK